MLRSELGLKAEDVDAISSVGEGAEEVPSQESAVGLGSRVPRVMSKGPHSFRLSYMGTLRFMVWKSKADAGSVVCSTPKTFSSSLYWAQAWLLIIVTGLQEDYLHF